MERLKTPIEDNMRIQSVQWIPKSKTRTVAGVVTEVVAKTLLHKTLDVLSDGD